ncbi:hypothetical protein AFLA_004739 [Aspergillus flavus NRRL3357]|nr:hypothetical protein AFLA_004739 [Aspergillus flavus NRRL3357]
MCLTWHSHQLLVVLLCFVNKWVIGGYGLPYVDKQGETPQHANIFIDWSYCGYYYPFRILLHVLAQSSLAKNTITWSFSPTALRLVHTARYSSWKMHRQKMVTRRFGNPVAHDQDMQRNDFPYSQVQAPPIAPKAPHLLQAYN